MRMLRRLSGRSHQVSTAVALFGPGLDQAEIESTTVWFVELSEEDIRGYVASGEPMDKAGAYAIQGLAGRWIPRLEGCYFNVVGLPVPRLFRMLRSAHLL
jgi:septum formation protein